MVRRKAVDIKYSAANIPFSRVREGLLQRREELEINGYRCAWKSDIDISQREGWGALREKGYAEFPSCLVTSFASKESGLLFTVAIYPKRERARIHGEHWVYLDEIEEIKGDFTKFKGLTGIALKLRVCSEPYAL